MNRQARYEHRFVANIPSTLEAGILYVSLEYGTVIHRCFCGCGEEVVTPLSPTDWLIIFNGDTVSLKPSVGNWNLSCRSHYILNKGKVIEAGSWNESQIRSAQQKDTTMKAKYYGINDFATPTKEGQGKPPEIKPLGPWKRVLLWLSKLSRSK